MRISTAMYFQTNITALLDKQADLNHLQRQLATGRRIVTPADDPVGAAHVLQTSQSLATTESHLENIQAAMFRVKQESVVLGGIDTVIRAARDVALGAQQGASMSERIDFAAYLRQLYQDLLAYANTQDANGDYLFAGSKANTQPFQQSAGPSNYQGNSVQLEIAVSNNHTLAVNDPGDKVFGVGTSSDPFAVIEQLINDLLNPLITGNALQNAAGNAVSGLTSAMSRVKSVHDEVANRLDQLQAALDTQIQFKLHYQNEITRVESVDMQKLAVELQLQQVSLQASQQAFVKASQLSLFNFL